MSLSWQPQKIKQNKTKKMYNLNKTKKKERNGGRVKYIIDKK